MLKSEKKSIIISDSERCYFLKLQSCVNFFFFRWWKTPAWCRSICNCANNYFLFHLIAWNIVNITPKVLYLVLKSWTYLNLGFRSKSETLKCSKYFYMYLMAMRWRKKKKPDFRKPCSVLLVHISLRKEISCFFFFFYCIYIHEITSL